MNDPPGAALPGAGSPDLEQQLREMNEALLVSSVRQHELTEQARKAETALRSHTEELTRFNRIAVGRELQMIDLKKEVNELRQRQGEAARYRLDFEDEAEPIAAESRIEPRGDGLVPLESVLCTEELDRRPARQPNYEMESRALRALAQALADSPRTVLQTLVETILTACQADSAGVSLLTQDGRRFYWPAIAGAWQTHIGGGTPRDFGPCGDVLDRNVPLLFRHLERRYDYFLPVTPPVEECLLVPFYVEGKAVGTIWAIAHDDRRRFDSEDLRQLESLGRFASAAYQGVESLGTLEHRRDAALNLMEDAVQARQAMETLNMELQESEARYRALFDAAPMAVFVCDRNAVIQQYNARAVELWGREPVCGVEQHCGSTKLWLPDGTLLPHPQSPIVEVLRTGVPANNVEVNIERPGGSRLPVLANFAPLKNPHGEITGAITSFIDITDRSRLEQKTKEQSEALADLHRRKDEFLAMLSHELRNPLAAICNAGHLLRLQKEENPLQQRARLIIERQAAQLTHLVDDLLEISRITTGRVQLRQERIAVGGIVERAVEAVQPVIDEQKHELTVSVPSETIWLHADPARLEQVVGNVLTNAAKYTRKGGHIWLTVQQEGDECVMRVRDTGVGIAPELLPHIFDLFTQADRSLDRSQGGLGIGLALVHRLVELHHGRVEVHSTLGHGSEFVVRLPVLPSLEPQTALPISEKVQPPARSLRVLVVEDNPDTAQGLALVLQAFGHQVRIIHDGLAALQIALTYQPHVVLLDIGLPGLNGFEVAKQMRRQSVLKDSVLVAVTGYGKEADHQRSQEAGFDYHLVKPADFKTVHQILAAVSDRAT